VQSAEGVRTIEVVALSAVRAVLDAAADREADIVRVDTRDEGVRDVLWRAVDDALAGSVISDAAVLLNRFVVVDAILAALAALIPGEHVPRCTERCHDGSHYLAGDDR
jgi:hypothetical protein